MEKEAEKLRGFILKGSEGIEPSIWELLCLSCLTLIAASIDTPQLKEPTRKIVGLLIDATIQDNQRREQRKDGILSIKS